jgi:hypothetical protein
VPAANAAPAEIPQGSETALAAANAALAESLPEILAGPDVPDGVKDACVLIDSSIRFYHPYRSGCRKVGEYERRKLTEDMGDIIRLLRSERAFWRRHAPKEFRELKRQWQSFGLPLNEWLAP